jgi:hypothetical protein
MIEEVDKSGIDDTVLFHRKIGGYFKRFRGGVLREWVGHPALRERLNLEERVTLAFLTVSLRWPVSFRLISSVTDDCVDISLVWRETGGSIAFIEGRYETLWIDCFYRSDSIVRRTHSALLRCQENKPYYRPIRVNTNPLLSSFL